MKTKYSREPIDYRLLLLVSLKRIRFVLYGICIGAILFGGLYYLVRTVMNSDKEYTALAEVYLEYSDDVEIENIYINQQTWATLIYSDSIMDHAKEQLSKNYSDDFIKEHVSATLRTSNIIVTITAVSEDEQEAVELANTFAKATMQFAPTMKEIDNSLIFTTAKKGEILGFEDRTWAMCLLGAIVGGIVVILALGFYFAVDESVYIPGVIEARYGFPALGIITDKMRKLNFESGDSYLGNMSKKNAVKTEFYRQWLQVNYKKITEGRKRIAIVGTSLHDNYDYVMNLVNLQVKELREKEIYQIDRMKIKKEDAFFSASDYELTFLGSVNDDPIVAEKAATYDGVIVLIKASDHNGKLIERGLDLLRIQGADVIGGILYETDAWLIRKYVFSPLSSSTKQLKEVIYNERNSSDFSA